MAFHLGHPIRHAQAPALFNQDLEARGAGVVLVPVDLAPSDLRAAVEGLRRVTNVVGFLVTMPHKQAIADLCDELGAQASLVGAANAVRVADGVLVGEMFDGTGLVRSLSDAGIDGTAMLRSQMYEILDFWTTGRSPDR